MRAFKIASRGYWYEFEELLEPLKKSLDLVIQDKDGKNLKAGRVLMASAYRYLGDLKRAREYIDFAGQTQEPTIPFVEFHYLAERSRIERFENKEEATFNTFKQAFVLASQSGLLYEAWLYALDLDLDSNEDKRIRVQRLEIALKAIKQINKDDFNATHNREILVYIYDEIGNFKRSLELNLENLENQPSEYIEEHVANIKLAIAKSYIGLKEYKKAMEAIQPYIDMHKEPYGDFAGDPDLTTDFNYFKCLGLVELGKILVGLGKFAEARKLQSE
jgi:tetratricopeptide (TPR) repeat protein